MVYVSISGTICNNIFDFNDEFFIDLLNSASYSLPKNNVYDLIIRFCFVEGIYNLNDVNELLDNYNCKLFSY